MTDIPLWQRQRDALQAEAQAAEAADAAAIAEIETALERLTQVTDLIRVQLRDSHGTLSIPVGGAVTYTTSTEPAATPPLTRAQIAQDRLQLGAAIYRPARPDEAPDLWVSDAHEGGDCRGYVRL